MRGNSRTYDKPQSALDDYRKAQAEFEELLRWDPKNRLWQRERVAAQLLVSTGIMACHTSKIKECKPMPSLEEAEATSLEAIMALRALTHVDPSNVSWQNDIRGALQVHARVLAEQTRNEERLAFIEESERIYRNSKPDNADAEGMAELGRLLQDKTDALAALGRLPEAMATVLRSSDLFKGLIVAHEDNPRYVFDLSEARRREAELRRKTGDRTGAVAANREKQQLIEKYWSVTGNRQEKAKQLKAMHSARVNEGAKLFNGGDHPAALRQFAVAESAALEYIRVLPTDFRGYDALRNVYDWIQTTQDKLSDTKETAIALSSSMHAAQIATLLVPQSQRAEKLKMDTSLAQARKKLGIFLYDNGRFEEALAVVQEEVVVAERLVQNDPQNPAYLNSLGNAKCGLGMVRRYLKKAGWEETIRSGLVQIQKAAKIDTKNPEYWKEVGSWRKYLAEELNNDLEKEKASLEYRVALEMYNNAARISPGDKGVQEALRELADRGVR
jgi:tetratricopeptide (TPR) repeat protein